MAQQSRSAVRSAFAARLGSLSGWTESRFAADVFGRDADSIAHQGFAVGLGATDDRREAGYRGRPAEGLLTNTEIIVRFGYRLQPKAQTVSRDAAETAGQSLVNRLMAYDATWPLDLKVQLVQVSADVSPSGEWFLGTQTYNVVHTLPLS